MSLPANSTSSRNDANAGRSLLVAVLSLFGVAGPVVFWIILLAAQSLYPSDDPWGLSLSTIALGPSGWLQAINFCLLAVSIMAFGAAVYLSFRRSGFARISAAVLMVAAISMILTAFFQVDTDLTQPPSTEYVVHKAAVAVAAGSFPLAALFLAPALWPLKQGRPFAWLSAVSAVIVFALDVVWLASIYVRPHLIDSWYGLYERILVSVPLAWMLVLSARVFAVNRRGPRPACRQ